jgi:gliding motility-associated lipoprotein GldD
MILKPLLSLLITGFLATLTSCNSSYQSKPKGYFKIQLPPSKSYQLFNNAKYPYQFEYPTYSKTIQDSTFDTKVNFETTPLNDYWVNIDFGEYRCKIYLSYSNVNGKSIYKVKDRKTGIYVDSLGQNSFEKLRDDAFNLTAKHVTKATEIPKEKYTTPYGNGAIIFMVGGQAASPVQFIVTDTLHHFLRGALYYDATPNPDSTRPVTNFLLPDIKKIINTLQWKK